jgi:hypothetical protein
MHDAGKIIPGLALFLVLATAPIWYNVASGHEALLSDWRDEAVRVSDRVYVTADGRRYEKSLTRTCLGCHQNKANSCDRCHDYLDVKPYCWECHVDPKGGL